MPMPTIISDKEDVRQSLHAVIADLDAVYQTVASMLYEGAVVPKDCVHPTETLEAVCGELEHLESMLDYAFASNALDAVAATKRAVA